MASEDLGKGSEITLFYPSFEWDMSSPFECWCGAPDCLRRIQGAKYIPNATLQKYHLADHIRELKRSQMEEEANEVAP